MSQVLLGANLTANDATSALGVNLGQEFVAADERRYIYVKAAAAVTQYAYVAIDNSFNATMLTSTLANSGYRVGCCQTALSSGYYGWALVQGSHNGLVIANNAANTQTYTTANAGYLGSASASQVAVKGVYVITSASASGSTPVMAAIPPFIF